MNDDSKQRWRWSEWAHLVLLLVTVASATYYLGSELSGVKTDVAAVEASLARVESGVKADVAGVADRVEAMETRMVALFADQLRDNQRDVADMRERVSALEAREG